MDVKERATNYLVILTKGKATTKLWVTLPKLRAPGRFNQAAAFDSFCRRNSAIICVLTEEDVKREPSSAQGSTRCGNVWSFFTEIGYCRRKQTFKDTDMKDFVCDDHEYYSTVEDCPSCVRQSQNFEAMMRKPEEASPPQYVYAVPMGGNEVRLAFSWIKACDHLPNAGDLVFLADVSVRGEPQVSLSKAVRVVEVNAVHAYAKGQSIDRSYSVLLRITPQGLVADDDSGDTLFVPIKATFLHDVEGYACNPRLSTSMLLNTANGFAANTMHEFKENRRLLNVTVQQEPRVPSSYYVDSAKAGGVLDCPDLWLTQPQFPLQVASGRYLFLSNLSNLVELVVKVVGGTDSHILAEGKDSRQLHVDRQTGKLAGEYVVTHKHLTVHMIGVPLYNKLVRLEKKVTHHRVSDDDLRDMWRTAGGSFHGPRVETGTMPEDQLLPFLRSLVEAK